MFGQFYELPAKITDGISFIGAPDHQGLIFRQNDSVPLAGFFIIVKVAIKCTDSDKLRRFFES